MCLRFILGFYASRVLQPHVKSLVGVAIDGKAVDAYDQYANQSNLAPEKMHAVGVPYMAHLTSLEGKLFDIILVSRPCSFYPQNFHANTIRQCAQPIEQRPDVASVIPMLTQLLKAGGILFLVSLDMSSRTGSARGDDEEELANPEHERIRELFTESNLVTTDIDHIDSYGYAANEPGMLFVAKGVKPPVGEDASTIDGDDK